MHTPILSRNRPWRKLSTAPPRRWDARRRRRAWTAPRTVAGPRRAVAAARSMAGMGSGPASTASACALLRRATCGTRGHRAASECRARYAVVAATGTGRGQPARPAAAATRRPPAIHPLTILHSRRSLSLANEAGSTVGIECMPGRSAYTRTPSRQGVATRPGVNNRETCPSVPLRSV